MATIQSPIMGQEPKIEGLQGLKNPEMTGQIQSPIIGREPEIEGLQTLQKPQQI